jgi:transglutaminase-like putative cysteine protease
MKEFLSRFNLALIISTYSAIVLTLFQQLNIYIVVFGLACVAWRIASFYSWVSILPQLWLTIISIVTTALTVALVFQQGVFNIMLHIIFLGFSLKFLELKSVRDVYFFVNTGFILIALFFIFNTSIVATFVVSFLALMLLGVLLSLHAQSLRKSAYLPMLLKSCLLSLPLALLLFVIMPRLPTLWKVPIQKQATTGLSDSVTPGDIANLSRSSALAFRATFKGPIATANERYWRAMTLDFFDGKTWSQSQYLKREEFQAKGKRSRQLLANNNLQHSQSEIKTQYELIIEPHYNYWVPALDYASTSSELVSLSDFSVRSEQPIVNRKAMTITQIDTPKQTQLTSNQRDQFTQLPRQSADTENRQTNAWIDENLRKGLNKEQILNKLLNNFSTGFSYTLSPPLLGDNQIDDFLFNSKAGFCVHFASSYLYVARKLGFPARMVTGYLGGEWQQTEGFFIIRQYDAHAWVEIWRNDAWQRVDPTAYVAAERVESGLEAGLTNRDEFLQGQYFSLQKWRTVAFVNQLRARLAQMDYLWARYVVNFDNNSQIKLMQKWVENIPWLKLTYGIILLMVTIFLFLLLLIFKPWKVKQYSYEDKVYLQLQSYFEKKGFEREKGQLVSEYCANLSKEFSLPDSLCQHFANKYNEIKYRSTQSRIEAQKLIKQLVYISKQIQRQSKIK